VTEQLTVQRLLVESYDRIKQRNPAYSLRAFAQRLGMSSGALSTIMRGQRRISQSMAERILQGLDADPKTRNGVLGLFSGAEAAVKHSLLTMDQFQLVSESLHFELLCLIETKGFREDAEWMAGRLLRSVRDIEQALERLLRLGMLKRGARGKLLLTGEIFQSPDGISDSSIRRSHFESLEQAKHSLEVHSVEERDFSSETMAIDPELLPMARNLLRDCRRKLSKLFDNGEKKDVYKLSMQLFPLSDLSHKHKKD
jgi:transcriptional regulator with XRE-family HTH domain